MYGKKIDAKGRSRKKIDEGFPLRLINKLSVTEVKELMLECVCRL